MRRRALLTSLAGGSALLAGCSALTSSGDVSADSPTTETPVNTLSMTEALAVKTSGPVSPGDGGTVAIAVAGATHLGFQSVPGAPGDEAAPVRFEMSQPEARFDPTPDFVFQTFPPGWNWQEPRDVRVLVPFEVSRTADTGRYPFSVGSTRREARMEAAGEVVVEN